MGLTLVMCSYTEGQPETWLQELQPLYLLQILQRLHIYSPSMLHFWNEFLEGMPRKQGIRNVL